MYLWSDYIDCGEWTDERWLFNPGVLGMSFVRRISCGKNVKVAIIVRKKNKNYIEFIISDIILSPLKN